MYYLIMITIFVHTSCYIEVLFWLMLREASSFLRIGETSADVTTSNGRTRRDFGVIAVSSSCTYLCLFGEKKDAPSLFGGVSNSSIIGVSGVRKPWVCRHVEVLAPFSGVREIAVIGDLWFDRLSTPQEHKKQLQPQGLYANYQRWSILSIFYAKDI